MKNVIFDFGQVIVYFNEENMTKRYFSNDEECETVSRVVFDRLYWDRFDDGSLSPCDAKPMMAKRLPPQLHEKAFMLLEKWYYDLEFIPGMCELIADLKQSGKGIYLLSNIGVDFAENYTKVSALAELFSLFDGLVFSSKIKKTKPSREAFEHLLKEYNLNPADCVFVDDREVNIIGAEKAGIKGILFGGDSDLLRRQIL